MTPFLGALSLVAFNYAPKGFALCNGQLLPINQNQALFALLGTTYGGDGISTFALPNLQGRVVVGTGTLTGGSTYTQGAVGGSATVQLTTAQLPSHSHGLSVSTVATPSLSTVSGNTVGPNTTANPFSTASDGSSMAPGAFTSVGGSVGHENRSPYLVLNWIIALQGIFPSRN